MSSNFETGAADRLMEKVSKDEDGELKEVVSRIVFMAKKASELGIKMDELASIVTMGWMMGTDPSIEGIFKFLMMSAENNKDVVN